MAENTGSLSSICKNSLEVIFEIKLVPLLRSASKSFRYKPSNSLDWVKSDKKTVSLLLSSNGLPP